ncbi:MAG: hypothetical protein ACE5OR_15340 [bacterium]
MNDSDRKELKSVQEFSGFLLAEEPYGFVKNRLRKGLSAKIGIF